MNKPTRRALSAVAATATLLGLAATSSTAVAATPATSGTASPSPAVAAERLIVGYKSGVQEARSNGVAAADAQDKAADAGQKLRFERRTGTGAAVFDLGEKKSRAEVADLMAEFRADPDVAFVEPELIAQPLAAAADPDDTDYAKQWDLTEATGGMNVPGAWPTTTGSGVTVAVIDTGYVAHSDLAGNISGGYDFISDAARARDNNGRDANPADEGDWYAVGECGTNTTPSDSSWHGTHVGGTIGAVTGNGKGIAGIAYGAKVQPVRVLGKCGGSSVDIADAITWASGGTVPGVPANANPAKVLNLSLGGASSTCPSTYQNAIDGAVSRGTTVVVAAGNSNQDISGFTPANCNNIISVASTNREGGRAFYSNFGTKVDISAPGGETRRATDTPGTITTPENGILSTVNASKTSPTTETYKPAMGTSMAAPHIAGLAALMKAAKPSLTPAQIETAMKASARALPGTCTGGCGAGIADAAKTIAALGTTTPTDPKTFTNATDVAIPDNGAAVTSSIAVTGVTGNAPATLKVAVDIRHTYRGDLVVDLVAPDGTVRNLKAYSGSDSADNVTTTYTVDASSEVANGTWKLRVQDRAAQDTGYVNSWGLTF
ncbi:S8 family peptidase [Streptomyces sp. t39]|uniref:S8 family peptidase n=1 Tax=Streptomyces sp. t39 TaxID=1828156 RepID=UPI0021C8684B|nr:S8 family serine peptidase [Streptomyces sp. t39]